MWNSAGLLAGIAWYSLVATAVFGGLAVVTGLVGGAAATRASDIKSVEDAKRIADADARAAEANARAEEAKADAARAHQRAEEASMEAEKVRERLQKAQEMRTLSKSQADALTPLLKSELFQKEPKPRITLLHVSDAEAEGLAYQMMDLFKQCNVNVVQFGEALQKTPSRTDFCLVINSYDATEENEPFARLQKAMTDSGLTVGTMLDDEAQHPSLIVLRKPAV
jgi:ribosome-binding ATPase YchF (GTP1/OBG family)